MISSDARGVLRFRISKEIGREAEELVGSAEGVKKGPPFATV
jgi:hypothetical protein